MLYYYFQCITRSDCYAVGMECFY